jgi:hypothetical protein
VPASAHELLFKIVKKRLLLLKSRDEMRGGTEVMTGEDSIVLVGSARLGSWDNWLWAVSVISSLTLRWVLPNRRA